jgi:threonine aldolase
LEHNIRRLGEDHRRARALGEVLAKCPYVKSMMPLDTNILIFELIPEVTPDKFLARLAEHQIKALPFGATEVRMVMHLDVDDAGVKYTSDVLKSLTF